MCAVLPACGRRIGSDPCGHPTRQKRVTETLRMDLGAEIASSRIDRRAVLL